MAHIRMEEERETAARLRDREEIRQIMFAYSRAADASTQEERASILAPVLAEDAVIEYSFGTWTGRGEVIAALGRMVRRFSFTHHIISNESISVDGDTAVATYVVTAAHGMTGRDVFWGGAHYTHFVVRTADGWRLKRHSCASKWKDAHASLPEQPGDVPDV